MFQLKPARFKGIRISSSVKLRSLAIFLAIVLVQSVIVPSVSALEAMTGPQDDANTPMAQNYAGPLDSRDAKYPAAADAEKRTDDPLQSGTATTQGDPLQGTERTFQEEELVEKTHCYDGLVPQQRR